MINKNKICLLNTWFGIYLQSIGLYFHQIEYCFFFYWPHEHIFWIILCFFAVWKISLRLRKYFFLYTKKTQFSIVPVKILHNTELIWKKCLQHLPHWQCKSTFFLFCSFFAFFDNPIIMRRKWNRISLNA